MKLTLSWMHAFLTMEGHLMRLDILLSQEDADPIGVAMDGGEPQ